ncbi:MAG: hypothetical protein GWN71_25330 [Gammaproteobacteria bacterium]|nr:hypothetical protein [Gemmatimonadota bacterium]NIR38706.1 hypothetical protein [Actinomycetota bacterium]NIU76762.1 hypothetical protein [Gammaproteobacteria bacterium]NIY10483.1 hypothetical protein [Gemmatimonadota bacterium]
MAKWWWGPFWAAEHRSRRDDADRVYQIDYRLTELHITNPTDRDGVVDLVFHEARGDGNFYRSDWASGSWSAPPRWQRYYRPDPSRIFGDRFFTYGWFEAWTSLDEILIDVRLLTIARNAAGGVVENIAERTLDLVPRRAPVAWIIPELIDRFRDGHRSHLYAPGRRPTDELSFLEPIRPGDSGDPDEP